MSQRLPRVLLRWLAIVAVVSFAGSMYLENWQLDLLQNHPISVNLLSGIVGFSTATLVIAVGFNWIFEREKTAAIAKEWNREWNIVTADARLFAEHVALDLRRAKVLREEPYMGPLEPGSGHDRFGMAMSRALRSTRAEAQGSHDPTSCLVSFVDAAVEIPKAASEMLERCEAEGGDNRDIKNAKRRADSFQRSLAGLTDDSADDASAYMSKFASAIEEFAELYYVVNAALPACASIKVRAEQQ